MQHLWHAIWEVPFDHGCAELGSEKHVGCHTSPTNATNRRLLGDQGKHSIACSHLLLRQVV
jgi:hypothetical protein